MRHHYVPQFLLRSWAKSMPDGRIEVFRVDLPQTPRSRHTPKYTGYEDDLYALSIPNVAGMDKQAVERQFLRIVDNRAALVLEKLENVGLKALTLDDRMDWARFLMSLRVRQPDVVHQLRTESSEQLEASLTKRPEEYEALAEAKDPPTLLEWTRLRYPGLIENFGLSFFHEIVDNPKVGEKILHMRWWLWSFDGNNELILADHPCIFTHGIDDPNLIIVLPISPRKAFMGTNSDHVAMIMRRQRPKDLLVRINESSLNQARARIYARDSSPSRFIVNRLAKRHTLRR
jgi:hypothetical protein